MTDIPPPLVPLDCDLKDFPFMPLHVQRLRDSDLAAEQSPETCWYALMLWAASWHQIPAASLPDNEHVLTKLCGLGRNTAKFKKHRKGALHGFTECSDGRLYHPVVAEAALEAWIGRLHQRKRSMSGVEARYGTPFDPAVVDRQIAIATEMLELIAADTRTVDRVRRRGHRQGQKPAKGGDGAE